MTTDAGPRRERVRRTGPATGAAPRSRRQVRPFRLRAVLFDFDGTLTAPGALDFSALKREVGCPPDRYVLEWIEGLPAGARRDAAAAALERFELAGASASRPNDGAEALVHRLRDQGLAVGVLTRNARAAVDHALTRFTDLAAGDFDVIVTRDDRLPPKPAPDGVVHAAGAMGVAPGEVLVVGDYLLDILAGRAAGAVTAFLTNGERAGPGATSGAGPWPGDVDEHGCPDGAHCDFVVDALSDLDAVARLGLPLPAGKLPNDVLAAFLGGVTATDPALLTPPAVGEDVAALDVAAEEVLVAHGDPITLGGDDLARSAIIVNANDIAASGADPRWLLATVLLPPGTTAAQALALLDGLAAAASAAGVTVAGGHTEVTAAVTAPVVSVTMLGTLPRAELRDKRDVRAGDRLVITKELAAEGTALLAAELADRLAALGMSETELAACRGLLLRASIVPEARVARSVDGVRAMHDVTEGGLATALRELAAATGHDVTVDLDRVPVGAETRRICELLGADPLGLIASGSLLVCCSPEATDRLLDALRDAGVPAAAIGEWEEPGGEVRARAGGRPAPWPSFAADEVARLLEEARPRG